MTVATEIVRKTKLIKTLLHSCAGSTIFRVRFTKRTTGEIREMVCRLNVSKGVKGVGQAYVPSEKGLINVYDMHRKGFRCIPTEGILALTIKGKTYNFK